MSEPRLYEPVAAKPDYEDPDWINKWDKAQKANEKELDACDDEAKKVDRMVGRFFQIQVADGYAIYQIVKENKKTVRVKRCEGICGDEYQDWNLGHGASMSKAKAQELIGFKDKLNEMFSKKTPKMKLHIRGVD